MYAAITDPATSEFVMPEVNFGVKRRRINGSCEIQQPNALWAAAVFETVAGENCCLPSNVLCPSPARFRFPLSTRP
jgi:hypothetical protein